MKHFQSLLLLIVLFCACGKEGMDSVEDIEKKTGNDVILVFESPESLLESISNGETHLFDTKAWANNTFMNLFTPVSQVEIEADPILSFEASKVTFSGEGTIYKAMGYNELIPNENFARLVNIRGEFRVGDTIYKISPRGTYYFPASYRESFESNYAEYENSEGEKVSERTYKMAPSVFRYDTFAGFDNDDCQVETKTIPGYNWNTAETHQESAGSVFENQIFYKDLRDNVRMKTRVYNHDYVVYEERGAYVKIQHKTWIGWWSDTENATKLGLGWNNIIMTKSYNGELGPILPGAFIAETVNDEFNGRTVSVKRIIRYNIPESDYNLIINGNFSLLRTRLLSATGIDIIGHDLVELIGPDTIQMIIPADYQTNTDIDEIKVAFSKSVMGPCFKFAAGQFYYLGQDYDVFGTMRVGTSF